LSEFLSVVKGSWLNPVVFFEVNRAEASVSGTFWGGKIDRICQGRE
jgi:hypothetical protein